MRTRGAVEKAQQRRQRRDERAPQKRRRATLGDNAPPAKRPPRGKPKKHSVEDAFAYIDLVKKELGFPGYNIFLDIMKEFKAQKITTANVLVRLEALYKGHPRRPELARGLNVFLPTGYQLESSPAGEVVMIDASDDDDDGFEMLETRTAEERVEAARARAEQQGDVVSLE